MTSVAALFRSIGDVTGVRGGRRVASLLAVVVVQATALAGGPSPFATNVVSYTPGTGVTPGYDNPLVSLGEPSRFTPDANFPGAVTPFNAPYKSDQIVSVGVGGSLVIKFDHPVANDPQNPFGVDLLVFGNSFFYDPVNFTAQADALFGGRGKLEVSPDGNAWTTVPSFRPDGVFPTLGYADLTDPFSATPGSVLTDFTRPVDPSFDWHGKNFAQLLAGYNGSGGGAGVDIGALGLSSVMYLRFTVPAGESGTVNIDGVSDVAAVPAPGAGVLMGIACVGLVHRRRRGA